MTTTPHPHPRRRPGRLLTGALAVIAATSYLAMTSRTDGSPASLGRPNPEGTSI